MAIYKCKMCGGQLEIIENASICTCEYCGTEQTLPKVNDEKIQNLFNRANQLRLKAEFDKAAEIYEKIIQNNEEEAEAYWGLILCKYGVEYVEDPVSLERIPTCHRASFDAITSDEDYKAALQYSDAMQRAIYEKQAKQLEQIQKEIIEIAQNEKPYDIFICYKETDANGNRTQDSVIANDIYHQLTQEGYKVFYAAITLEDKLGQEYEPYIFSALNSAKVLLAIGTKPEYFNAVWVKNEWSRFLKAMKTDRTRLLIPCYRDMDAYELPEEFAHLQAQDMSKIGFVNDLVRGIKKVIHKETDDKNTTRYVKEPQNIVGISAITQIKRGNMALEDREWKQADKFFEEALNLDAECAEAYLGKFLAQEQCINWNAWIQKATKKYSSIMKEECLCACNEAREHIEEKVREYQIPDYLYENTIREFYSYNNRDYKSILSSRISQKEDQINEINGNRIFARAMQYAGEELRQQLQEGMEQLYATLDERIQKAKEKDRENVEQINAKYAAYLVQADQRVKASHDAALEKRESDYQAIVSKMKEAQTISEYVEIKDLLIGMHGYKDTQELANECQDEIDRLTREELERKRQEEEEKKRLEEEGRERKKRKIKNCAIIVLAIFATTIVLINVVASIRYNNAVNLVEEGKYREAINIFADISYYKDSRDRIRDILTSTVCAGSGHTVGLRSDGSIVAKGYNDYGQLNVNNWEDIIAVSAGSCLTVGLRSDGSVVAAGDNKHGECNVEDWKDIIAVSAGGGYTVGLKSNGRVVATGYNHSGECDVERWRGIVAVSAGSSHTVGLRSDGRVVATGKNDKRQCDVEGWKDIIAVSAGSRHTVGLRSDGSVVATGSSMHGQCTVEEWEDIVAVSAGSNHTVGLKLDGSVVATGDNDHGQCNVYNWRDIIAVSAGGDYTIGLRSDGSVVATGNNIFGQCNVENWNDIKIPEILNYKWFEVIYRTLSVKLM